jgi:hypothetical protein
LPVAASIGAAGAVVGGGLGLFGSLTASSQQANTLKQAQTLQEQMFAQSQGALQPYYTSGASVAPILESLLTPGPNQTQALSQLPGFQFAQDWGQKAVQNLGTTTGLGGNTLTAGANFATGLAQQGFSSLVNPLLQMYQTGAGAASSLGGTAASFGQTIGNTTAGIGQAQAAGTLGATNALSGAATGAGNSYLTTALFSRLLNPGTSSPNPGIYSTNSPFALTPNQPFQTAASQ